MTVYHAFDQAALDAQYNCRAMVPEHPRHIEGWAHDSEAVRTAHPDARLDLAYGSGERERLDFFPAQPGAPLHLFIHGGYWRALDKANFSYPAAAFASAGVAYAAINYPLAPRASVDVIVASVRRALAWLIGHAGELGVDPASLGTIPLDTYYNDQLSQDVMTVMQQNLADIGIQVELMPLDGASWSARYYDNNESSMSFLGGANGADPNRAYQYFYSSSPGNTYNYSNPALDELLEAGRKEMDPDARTAIYQEACTILGQDQPWIFLWQTTRYSVVSTRISNFLFTPAAGGGSYYDQAELWDIEG